MVVGRIIKVTFMALLFSSFVFTGFIRAQTAKMTRAIYVTRWDFTHPADIRRIVENTAAMHFNVILFQVRGDGTVCYRSRLEPWSSELGSSAAAWDPLQLAVELAHAHNIQLHAWMNVYPAWMGLDPPGAEEQLYHAHPDWLMTDAFGQKQTLSKHYVWLSPTHPEVTPYLLSVCKELYTHYDIDGIHLDYIRFPSLSYSHDRPSLERFVRQHKTLPQQNPLLWSNWRREAISDFIARLYQNMKKAHPHLTLTASVMGDYAMAHSVYLQDSHAWLARGIIDAIYPMIYTQDDTLFRNQLLHHRFNSHNRHVFPSIYAGSPAHMEQQLHLTDQLGCRGVGLFSYDLLFPDHQIDAAFAMILKQSWRAKTEMAPMNWKSYIGDSQGPVVQEVYTLPKTLFADSEFKIAARITDPSGVFDDKTGSEGTGIYLVYDRYWPPASGTEVKMSALKDMQDWYITDRTIPAQKMGLDFRFRIFAWDNYHESANHPKRNLGYSDIWSLSILAKDQSYICKGTIGPPIYHASVIALDHKKQIWIGADHEDALVILDENGEPMPFSPLRSGLNREVQPLAIAPVVALAYCPPQTMCLLSASEPTFIFRYDVNDGSALQGLSLPFAATGIDCDGAGRIYVLEEGTTRWHVFSSVGTELVGSPFGIQHSGNDLAVLDDGSRVFISDRTTGGVQCWHGAVEGFRARYWRERDLPAVDVGISHVTHDSADFVYVPHSERGLITIFSRTGKPLQHLQGGIPPLNAPIGIASTPSGDSLLVLENVAAGPTRLSLWLRKKSDTR
ncbi:family 10 glycosylhydrolase [candidate division KSB1 bacterium]|nr:family 10 glycosylhydrolase [candidate division KSB1 bacterium]